MFPCRLKRTKESVNMRFESNPQDKGEIEIQILDVSYSSRSSGVTSWKTIQNIAAFGKPPFLKNVEYLDLSFLVMFLSPFSPKHEIFFILPS